jgi:hypothetical protein
MSWDKLMNKYMVITSINPPTEAVVKFSKIKSITTIVIGDVKSPSKWNNRESTFYSLESQNSSGFDIVKNLPLNHYSRKNIGYLIAIKAGADFIIDSDDDNIPYRNYFFPEMTGNFDTTPKNLGYINIYNFFSDEMIWPRGFPLNLISESSGKKIDLLIKDSKVGVWQALADEDPDVDAIYRLIFNKNVTFKDRNPVVLDVGTLSPFNSQNTQFTKEVFSLLYLPSYVSFRFCDILRSLVAQPILWTKGYKVGFLKATVIQKRNEHDLFKDFLSEIPMYTNNNIVDIVNKVINPNTSIQGNLLLAYKALYSANIVPIEEITLLEKWIEELRNLGHLY